MAIAVFFAEGFEEIEGLTVVDLTRRAGIETWMISINKEKQVTGSHGIGISVDKTLEEVDFQQVEMIVLPGGMPGTLNLGNCRVLTEQIKAFHEQKKYVAAICAAPTVFGKLGILRGEKACCYPGMEEQLEGALVGFEPCIRSGHIVTSRGMGTAIDFGLQIVALVKGEEEANKLAKAIVYQE